MRILLPVDIDEMKYLDKYVRFPLREDVEVHGIGHTGERPCLVLSVCAHSQLRAAGRHHHYNAGWNAGCGVLKRPSFDNKTRKTR